ncbi:hypothetical protein QBC34DRAFT_440568 [Podospora aff. communis PSN243]|uniref:Ysc84 actin-binding domain-containing protein n=1 Tax=Podospora aff. communis PSN243 TaxID=3040156 RepID=A0AAV9GFC6_9PEZI|nr:hypothetical protein QBC34DRAFT_440568 [Podospora aff. communis PSN243]
MPRRTDTAYLYDAVNDNTDIFGYSHAATPAVDDDKDIQNHFRAETSALVQTPPTLIKQPTIPVVKYPKHPFHNAYYKLGAGAAWFANGFGLVSPFASALAWECRKAATILRKFTGEGDPLGPRMPRSPGKKTAPERRTRTTYPTLRQDDLQTAHGLVIFSLGLDLVEAVMVLPTAQAAEKFKESVQVTLDCGAGYSLGLWGHGLGLDLISNAAAYDDKPKIYARSRGLTLRVTMEAKYIGPRRAADELFYGTRTVTTNQILRGNVPQKGPAGGWPEGARPLMEVLVAEAGPCHWGISLNKEEYQ